MKYDLPNDLKNYEKTHKRAGILISVITLAVALGILAALIVLTLDKGAAHTALLSTFYIIVVGAILIWSKIPKRFTDKTFCGKIKDVSVYSRRISSDPAKPAPQNPQYWHMLHTVTLEVRESNGHIVNHVAMSVRQSSVDAVAHKYKEGDEVFHLYGTDVTVMLPGGADSLVLCPVCGESNKTEDDVCRKCGHTLIKSIDMICKK